MRKLLYAIVAVFTFVTGCAAVAIWLSFGLYYAHTPEILPLQVSIPWLTSSSDPETERYAVYSAVIKELYYRDGATLLVIRKDNGSTRFSDVNDDEARWRNLKASDGFADLEFETLVNYLAADKELGSLDKQIDLSTDYALISKTKLNRLFTRDKLNSSWERFDSEYSGASGIIDLSNVGFNRDMNQAFLYTGFICADTCGSGRYVQLNKEYGVWTVRSTVVIWIS